MRERFSQTTHLKNAGVNQHYHIPAKSMLYNTGNAMILAGSPLLKIGKVSSSPTNQRLEEDDQESTLSQNMLRQ